MKRIYVASSWRNTHHPAVVEVIREAGFEVYDFRHPEPGNDGFGWQLTSPGYELGSSVDCQTWQTMTMPKAARDAFHLDFGAMRAADAGVLVLPSGRSAHLEAGFFVGARKPLIVVMLEPQEPELMYLMANAIVPTIEAAVARLKAYVLRET